jgi:hypothetical protein
MDTKLLRSMVLWLVFWCSGCGNAGRETIHDGEWSLMHDVRNALVDFRDNTGHLPSDWKELRPFMKGLDIDERATKLPLPLEKTYVFQKDNPKVVNHEEHGLPPGRIILMRSMVTKRRDMNPTDREGRYLILLAEDGVLIRTWLPERDVQASLAQESELKVRGGTGHRDYD